MFDYFNLFSYPKKTVDSTLLSTNDSLADKINEDYTILYSNGTKSIIGIPDQNLLPGIYRNHLLELIIFDYSGNKQYLVKEQHNSYTNINNHIFIIKNINKIIPYTCGKMVFSLKPYNDINDERIHAQITFKFKLNGNPPENSYIAIEEKNTKLLLYINVINNIYSIKDIEYHIFS